MKKRTYRLTETQKKAAAKWFKKGYTTHGKLSRKLGVSRQKVSSWLKSQKLGKRTTGAVAFWKDVKTIKELKGVSRKQATKEVKFSMKWYERKMKKLSVRGKARYEMKKKWYDISKGQIEHDYWQQPAGEELMETAEYD